MRKAAGVTLQLSLESDLDELVARYRAGDTRAAETLLDRFEPYLRKWFRLITSGRWDTKDPELLHFVRMFGQLDAQNAAQILVQRLRAYEREDLHQEVKLALLQTAFHYGNIAGMYRYVLKDRLAQLTADPLISARVPSRGLEAIPCPRRGVEAPEIDEDWVSGLTCGPGFDQLTERQRRILQLHKHLGLPELEVAELLEISVRTVKRDLQDTREKLAPLYTGSAAKPE